MQVDFGRGAMVMADAQRSYVFRIYFLKCYTQSVLVRDTSTSPLKGQPDYQSDVA